MQRPTYLNLPHLATVLLGITLLCGLPGVAGASPDKLPTIRIQTEQLSPREVGIELGRQSKQLFPNIEQHYDLYLSKLLNKTQFTQISNHALPALLNDLEPHYLDEMAGIATVWNAPVTSFPGDGKLSLTELQILNLLPDLGFAPNGTGFGAFAKAAADNRTLVGRNLDWATTPGLRQLQVITVYQHPNNTVVSVGFAGVSAILTGFSGHGVFGALFNAAPYSPYFADHSPVNHTYSATFDLRSALQQYRTVAATTRFLKSRHYQFDTITLLADPAAIQVLEHPAGRSAKVRRWDSTLVSGKSWQHPWQIGVVDCFLLNNLKQTCHDSGDDVRWQRLNQLAAANHDEPVTPQRLSQSLLDTHNRGYEIFNRQTVQSLVYQPHSQEIYLSTAPINLQRPPQINPPQLYTQLIPKPSGSHWRHLWKTTLMWLALITLITLTVWAHRRYR